MSQLWFKQRDSDWATNLLTSAVRLTTNDANELEFLHHDDSEPAADRPMLVCHRSPDRPAMWLIIAPSAANVTVNGERLSTGVRALSDRDAIRLQDRTESVYFSTEQLARVEGFPDQAGSYCPRCKLEIEPDGPSVRCPTCLVWYHETEADGRRCWSYSATCALCDQSTDLDDPSYRWRPDEL